MDEMPHLEELHLSQEPDVSSVPGPQSQKMLRQQEKLDSNAIAYPKRLPLSIDTAKGATIKDADGNIFIDFFAGIGVLNVGHSNPYILDAVHDQLDKVTHTIDFPSEPRIELIKKLNEIAPSGLQDNCSVIFGGPSGSDAIEGSIKLAKHNTGRHSLLAFEGSYHGGTAGALSLTAGRKYKKGYTPLLADVVHVPYPSQERLRDTESTQQGSAYDIGGNISSTQALEAVKQKLEGAYAGHEKPAGIWVEPIQGEGGVVAPPEGFLQGLRDLADDNDTLLIFDEIQTGIGRTGEWFAADHYDVTPDAMTMAKSVGGSGLPLGAMMYHDDFDTWEAGGHVGTFRGNAPAMIGGVRAIEYIQEQDLLAHARDLGQTARSRFTDIAERTPQIVDVRGKGLFIGIEFVENGAPAKQLVRDIQTQCYKKGVLIWTAGRNGNVLRLIPPLVITERQMEVGLDIVSEAIESVVDS